MRNIFTPRAVRWLLVTVGLIAAVLVFPAPAGADDAVISGRIVVSQTDRALAGVAITVTDANGTTVQELKSGEDGRFRITLPAAGTYNVTIDPKTLPKDLELVDPSKTTKTVVVNPGTRAAVAFRVTDGSSLTPESDSRVFQLLFEGLRFGLLIAIAAIGASLIFGTTGLTNFAHGELVAVGAFAAWLINTTLGAPFWLATIGAVAVGAVLGAGHEVLLWRPLRRRGVGLIAALIASIGLMLALRNGLLIVVGGDAESYDVPAEVERDYGLFSATNRDLIVMAIAAIALVGVAVLLQRTRIGTAMRAVADNRDLAAASGIDVNRVVLIVWILAGALAALGGVLYGWALDLRYDMGFQLLLMMFAGMTLGGLGTAYGALVGSLLIGVIVQMSTLVIPSDIKYAAALAVLIAVLLARPQGILGARARVG